MKSPLQRLLPRSLSLSLRAFLSRVRTLSRYLEYDSWREYKRVALFTQYTKASPKTPRVAGGGRVARGAINSDAGDQSLRRCDGGHCLRGPFPHSLSHTSAYLTRRCGAFPSSTLTHLDDVEEELY